MANVVDYIFAVVAGSITGVFLLPILYNLHHLTPWTALAAFAAPPAVFAAGVWLGKFLGRWLRFFIQFGKFAVVGFTNAAIDFGTLNLLSALTGTTSGFVAGGINIPGFLLAATNSYFWNKFWVFQDIGDNVFADLPKFSVVILSGAFLNSALVVLLTTYVGPHFGASAEAWLNVSKVCASATMLVWNFLGYKFFAFNPDKVNG